MSEIPADVAAKIIAASGCILFSYPVLHSRGHRSGDAVLWQLNNHLFEFTAGEFLDIIQGIRETGLFQFLNNERPALRDQLISIGRDLDPEAEEDELEHKFEQCLLDLKERVRR